MMIIIEIYVYYKINKYVYKSFKKHNSPLKFVNWIIPSNAVRMIKTLTNTVGSKQKIKK